MDFGKVIKRGFDENGNTNEVTLNIVDSMINYPISETVEIRVKVHNLEEEIEEYRKFSEAIKGDPEIVRPEFRLERSKTGDKEGYYYVVKSFTKLERFAKV